MQTDRKTASMLSLCQRAGFLVCGEQAVELALKDSRAKLVIIAEDASQNTKKKFLNKSEFYKVNVVVYGSKQELSNAAGKYKKAVFAVTENDNFAERILQLTKPALP